MTSPSGRYRGIWLRAAIFALTILSYPVLALVATADAAVTSGPSYVQVPGSPFGVGETLDAVAFNPAGSALAADDYADGDLDVLSFDPTTGALAPVAGSPFASGNGADSVVFSPSGTLAAAANLVADTVSVFEVSAAGVMTPVPGSPAATGNSPRAAAFSPSGGLLAVANSGDDTVSVFTVGAGGALASAPGSPFATGSEPVALSFSPGGNLLATANEGDSTVSLFTVDPGTGALTPSAGSPLSVGDGPAALAFNAAGSLLAVADSASSTVSVFTTGASATAFVPVPGSPFATGADPLGIAFDSRGDLLATADFLDGTVALFDVSGSGTLALAQGAPFASGSGPHSVAFAPNSQLLAVANANDGTVSVLEPMPPPTVAVALPVAGHSYVVGRRVLTHFSCLDSSRGPGIASCKDGSGHNSPSGVLNTGRLGPHTYTVTATSADGLTATATVAYVVQPVPPVSVSPPRLTGTPKRGHLLRCSRGSWRRRPTSYSYQWERGGVALGGATHPSYRVSKLDEGSRLACSITASNGSKTQATSRWLSVPLVTGRGCPTPTGHLSGSAVGSLKLGDTRAQAKAALRHARTASSSDSEQFCLSPAGITIGFPDPALASLLHRPRSDDSVWELTANPHYSIHGVAPGIGLAAAEQQLGTGSTVKRGRTIFYLVKMKASTIVLVAKSQVVEQIGIAENRVTANPALIAALVASLPR